MSSREEINAIQTYYYYNTTTYPILTLFNDKNDTKNEQKIRKLRRILNKKKKKETMKRDNKLIELH